ncbi:phage holin family protein [Saccharopolyspora sp. NPDC002376]
MGHVNSAQNSTNGNRDGAGWTAVTSIPLSEEGTAPDGQSVGALVRDATTHLSTLVRSEVELAKTELAGEAKKAIKGSVYFILALTVLGFSLFFLFFTLAEGLAQLGLWRWAAFGIVFLLMLVVAGLLAFLGYRRVRKIRAPKRTIESLKETSQLTKRHKDEEPASA